MEGMYSLKKPRFPMDTITKILNATQGVSAKNISRDKGIMQLLGLDIPLQEVRLVKTIIQLMDKLPCNPISDDINESELGYRYIDPFLYGLFDDPDQGMYLRWTNEITIESRKNDDLTNKTRPNICITRLCGSRFSTNHGFGEVKSAAYNSNHFLLCKDFFMGQKGYLYILLLPTNGMYMSLELGKVQVPNSLQDLAKLVMDAPLLLLILDVFERLCIPSNHERNLG
ncbi:hypothetical protein RMATCC62417_16048 [Rhizopus microsporus]|nr:hypothetical protein RMATCC62417_16048 [Rhizopus microsporus]